MNKNKGFLFILMLFLTPGTVYAGGGGGVPVGATEFTQILNNIELVASVAKQAEVISNQIQMIQHQVEGLKSIRTLSTSEWGQTVAVLRQLETIVRHGKALSYSLSNIEEEFKRRFPGYKAPENYQQTYQNWSETTLDTIQSSLMAAGFQANQFETENSTLKTLSSLSDNAVGQTQAIQAGNMIAGQLVNQLQLLRELHMSQMQAQNAYMAREVSKEDALNASLDQILHPIKYDGNAKRY